MPEDVETAESIVLFYRMPGQLARVKLKRYFYSTVTLTAEQRARAFLEAMKPKWWEMTKITRTTQTVERSE
jgi:hypothetical protein